MFSEQLRMMGDGDEVRKLCQSILLRARLEHDFCLGEANLYLNQAEALTFGRQYTVLPALNDKKVNLRVAANACVLTDTVGELYDDRHNKPRFQQLVESYNRALEAGDEPPCSKDPTRYSLYEFASMFDKQWGRLEPFKFVHVVPSIRRRPNKRTNPEFHRNFMLIMLRLHDPDVRPLNELRDNCTDEQLDEMGTAFFGHRDAPGWAAELWFDNVEDVNVDEVIPLFAPNLQPEPDTENAFVGEGLLTEGNANNLPDDTSDPVTGQDIPDAEVYSEDLVTPDYDKLEDKNNLCPDMLPVHPPRFRARVKEIPPPSGNHGQALDHRLLNPKQALAVEYVRQKLERVITEDEQFFLEICGQAGTGKTEILKRILADLAVRLADSTTRSVGTMVRFAAATGAAAKLMPQPNSTIHSLVNAPIDLKNNQCCNPLPSVQTLQDNLRGLKVIILDEKSLIGLRLLYILDTRLRQIFGKPTVPYGGISIILMGDFQQLAPVLDLPP